VTKALNEILLPIQEAFQASNEWQQIAQKAYPPPPPPPKKEKKVKDKGSRHPGGKPKELEDAAKEADLPVRPAGEGSQS